MPGASPRVISTVGASVWLCLWGKEQAGGGISQQAALQCISDVSAGGHIQAVVLFLMRTERQT